MKSLELENYGVQELDVMELITIEGGSWFGKAWKTIKTGVMIAIGVVMVGALLLADSDVSEGGDDEAYA